MITTRPIAMSRAITLGCTALLVASAGVTASAGAAKHHYPAKEVAGFKRSCTKTAKDVANGKLTKKQATTYCDSTLTCVEGKLTYKQFEATVEKMQSGEANPNAKVLTACEKAAIKKAGIKKG